MIVRPDIVRRILGNGALPAALATFAYSGTGRNGNDRVEGQGVDTAVVVVPALLGATLRNHSRLPDHKAFAMSQPRNCRPT